MGYVQDYITALHKHLRIGECTNVEIPSSKRFRNPAYVGRIHRLSKRTYVYHFQRDKRSAPIRGKANTFDQALVLLFALRRNKTLFQHKIAKFKPRVHKTTFPHQERVIDFLSVEELVVETFPTLATKNLISLKKL